MDIAKKSIWDKTNAPVLGRKYLQMFSDGNINAPQ